MKCCSNFHNLKNKAQVQKSWNKVNEVIEEEQNEKSEKSEKCCSNFHNLKNKAQVQESWNKVNEVIEEEQNENTKSEKSGADELLLRIVHVNWVGAAMNVNVFLHFHYNSGKRVRKNIRAHPVC